jgi:hypothetical protein
MVTRRSTDLTSVRGGPTFFSDGISEEIVLQKPATPDVVVAAVQHAAALQARHRQERPPIRRILQIVPIERHRHSRAGPGPWRDGTDRGIRSVVPQIVDHDLSFASRLMAGEILPFKARTSTKRQRY